MFWRGWSIREWVYETPDIWKIVVVYVFSNHIFMPRSHDPNCTGPWLATGYIRRRNVFMVRAVAWRFRLDGAGGKIFVDYTKFRWRPFSLGILGPDGIIVTCQFAYSKRNNATWCNHDVVIRQHTWFQLLWQLGGFYKSNSTSYFDLVQGLWKRIKLQ